jgi:hypothetical protein
MDMTFPSVKAWAALERDHRHSYLIRRCTLEGVARLARGPAYLATPYTKLVTDGAGCVDWGKAAAASHAAAVVQHDLALRGVSAWSPIVQAQAMLTAGRDGARVRMPGLDPLDTGFWEAWCRPWLHAAEVVIVPTLPGWHASDGVWREANIALDRLRRVLLLDLGSS